MGKFRSKLKRHHKGKAWGHGQSSTSNPQNTKHRSKAQSRFFHTNLNLDPSSIDSKSALTTSALSKHDARLSYVAGKGPLQSTVNDIAQSLKSFTFDGDENMTESQMGSFKTYQTFASNYSTCTNMSFSKLLHGFRSDSPLHKEMLAILSALTEIIKERGGSQSSTEYFLALMETLEASREDNEIIASVSLLHMGIRSVPEAVLRKKFSETSCLLLDLVKRFVDTENQNILKNIIGCLSVILRAQEYSLWTLSSTLEFFDAILAFSLHSKPKVRKAAQHAISSIIHGSCFMRPPPCGNDGNEEEQSLNMRRITWHPASGRLAQFCIKQFKPENIGGAQTIVLHTLGLLRDTINGFKSDDIKSSCEHLLSIMTAANVLIRTNCFQTIHSLFSSKSPNLTAELTAKVIGALYDYRPEKSDSRQTLAWLTVLKEGHMCLASYDIGMCINSLPKLTELCANDLWMSERSEIVAGASNTIKEMLIECIQPGCETKQLAEIHRIPVTKCLNSITKALSAPFGHVATQVMLIFATVFETTGKFFADALQPALSTIGARYDVKSTLRLQIEHAVLSAIPTMGPDQVIRAIPLTDSSGDVSLNKSWILPLLREAITESSLEFFATKILSLASQCYSKWQKYKESNQTIPAHTYELLCCQLWGLFPGFCRKPIDIYNFRHVAKTLGNVLNENPEIRASVLDGLKELMTNADDDGKNELSKFAKNFLPRLFNIYTTKPNGSYENEMRKNTLCVIEEYLKITPKTLLSEMFESAKKQHESLDPKSFTAEAVLEILEQLAIYQSTDHLQELWENLILKTLKKVKVAKSDGKNSKLIEKQRKERRKAYQFVEKILASSNEGCVEFVDENVEEIQNAILRSMKTKCKITQTSRLNCMRLLIDRQQDNVSVNNILIKRTISQIVAAYTSTSSKNENVPLELIYRIGDIYQSENQLNDFIDILTGGFKKGSAIIANTILVLKAIIAHFADHLTIQTLEYLLEQVLAFLVGRNRNEVEAAIAFLIGFIKALPPSLVANHLSNIMKSISAMTPDTKRYCRIHIGYVLRKLCKKFSAEEVIKLVPGNDEVTHKKLKNIRKEQNRLKRQKLDKDSKNENDSSDDDLSGGLSKKSIGIEDILAESESDLDDEMDSNEPKQKKGKKQDTYIQEDVDTIVDLADINSIGRITTSKPVPQQSPVDTSQKKKEKDSKSSFKVAEDGRIIVEIPKKRSAKMVDSDDEGSVDDSKATLAGSKKRSHETDSDDEDEDTALASASSRKRKAIESQSQASGRTGASSKYKAGGKGIHRPVAASVKSARSGVSMATTKAAGSQYGSEYQSKKGRGDVKKKGKMDPYAYIPLSRNNLNKRKRAKNAGQFKSIVKGARKGAAAGAKHRITKK